jgi:hypothetical protein
VQSALKSERDAQAQNIKDQANLDLQMYGFKQKDIQAGVDAYFHKYDAYTRAATTAIDDAENNARAVHIAQIQDDAAMARTNADNARALQVANLNLDKGPEMQYAKLYAAANGNPNDPNLLRLGLDAAFRARSIYGSAGMGANEKALSATNAIIAQPMDPRTQQYLRLAAQDTKNATAGKPTTLAQDFYNQLLQSQQNAIGAGASQPPNSDPSLYKVTPHP